MNVPLMIGDAMLRVTLFAIAVRMGIAIVMKNVLLPESVVVAQKNVCGLVLILKMVLPGVEMGLATPGFIVVGIMNCVAPGKAAIAT